MTSMLRNQSPATNENDIRMRSNRPGKDNKESKESKDNQAAQQQQQQQGQQNQQPEGGSSQPSSPAHTRDRGLAKKCCFCWCCAPPCFSKYVLSETSLSLLSTSEALCTCTFACVLLQSSLVTLGWSWRAQNCTMCNYWYGSVSSCQVSFWHLPNPASSKS